MPDVVALEIGGRAFSGWESVTITRALDAVADAFSLSAPFDPNAPEVRAAFRPFGYPRAVVKIDGEEILTGRLEAVEPTTSAGDRAINAQGRSLTGALIDCAIDAGGYVDQGLSLLAIARKRCAPFGIEVVSVVGNGPTMKTALGASSIAEAEAALAEAQADPGQSVFEYLNRLAQDGGLLLTSDVKGRLVITKVQPGAAPSASLVEGRGPVMEVTATFDGTRRFSRYKVLQQQDGATNLIGTADDGGVPIYRPRVVAGSEVDAKNLEKSARWARAMGLADAISLTATLDGWRTPAGAVWTPGMVVTLLAPGAYITRETSFVVAGAMLALDAQDGRTTELRLVLPATYSGEMPGSYPWD